MGKGKGGLNRSVSIPQPNIFGRIGTGVGQGLAEQLPKELENYRLKTGLKNIADQADSGKLSPAQFLAQTAGTYGVTPQIVQSMGELAKIQNQGNAYKNAAVGGQQGARQPQASPQMQPQQDPRNVTFANLQPSTAGQGQQQQNTPNVSPKESGQPQIVGENPLDPKFMARQPWTPQQRNQAIAEHIGQGFLPDQAAQMAADDEDRYLGVPEVEEQNLTKLKGRQADAKAAFQNHLETKLQKRGDNTFEDLTGEMQKNLERGMERDLKTNPKASIEDVANDWSNRALNLVKAKKIVEKIGKTTGIENLWKGKDSETKLKAAQQVFEKAGNLEEFYNILGNNDFGMSPQGRSEIAFPLSQKKEKVINSIIKTPVKNGRFGEIPPSNDEREAYAVKAALDIQNAGLDENDSLLTIARKLSLRDPYFDQNAFFGEFLPEKKIKGLNDRHEREAIEGKHGLIPNWGDIKYLHTGRP